MLKIWENTWVVLQSDKVSAICMTGEMKGSLFVLGRAWQYAVCTYHSMSIFSVVLSLDK